MQTSYISESDEKRIDYLRSNYSDEELLMELRRRDRFARIEVQLDAAQFEVDKGLPLDYQIRKAWQLFAAEAADLHMQGNVPAGANVESVRGDSLRYSSFDTVRRVKFAVNYVIDAPKVKLP